MSDPNNPNPSGEPSDKLYAGKYKTVEALEEGYKLNSRAQTKVTELESKLAEVTKVPDDYQTPGDIALHSHDIDEAKKLAKSTGMTQAQYEKFVREQNQRGANKLQEFENAKKEIGADGLNVLQDYVNKMYPEKNREVILNHLIMNKEARADALQHRQSLLNSAVPGVSGLTPNTVSVTHDDMIKARDYYQKNKHDMKARSRYLKIQQQLAHQKNS